MVPQLSSCFVTYVREQKKAKEAITVEGLQYLLFSGGGWSRPLQTPRTPTDEAFEFDDELKV